jgi:hypothetical protein
MDNLIILAVSLVLESWLLVLLFLRNVRSHFPVFFYYLLLSVPVTVARLLTIADYRTYFFVYWWSDALLLLLGLAALHEVFHWVYEGFYRLPWFRLLYYGAIAVVLLVTVRNAMVNPPVQAHPIIGLILNAGIAINLLQVAIVAVFGALVRPLEIPFRRYPFGIVSGFGASALGPLIGYFLRSVFGTNLDAFTRYASAVAYILALVIWLMAFSRQEPEEKAWTPPMPPDEMLRVARGYLKVLRPGRKANDP